MGRFYYYITTDGTNVPRTPDHLLQGESPKEEPGRMYLAPDANGWERYRIDAMSFTTQEEAEKYAFDMVAHDKEFFAKVGVEKLWYEPPDLFMGQRSALPLPFTEEVRERLFQKQMEGSECMGPMVTDDPILGNTGLVRGGPQRDTYTVEGEDGETNDF